MLRRLALAVGCAVAFNAAAQGLFDDNEARRRIDVLRSEVSENQRQVAEQLKKLDATLSSASDRSALLQIANQVETLNTELARMRGQLETLARPLEHDAGPGKVTRRYWVVAVDALGQEGFPSAPAWHYRQFRRYYEPFVGEWHQ